MDLRDKRRDYVQARLTRDSLLADPMEQFKTWFAAVIEHGGLPDPTAFTLATVDREHRPHQRIVLLKEMTDKGFIFYTNHASAKGQDIANNPYVAMNFAWLEMERQVRIEGIATKLAAEHADAYFRSRPVGSQLGALTSAQSQPIDSRTELETRYHALESEYQGKPIPKPEHWGGYVITPSRFEFWQGGRYRLHDRFEYQHTAKHQWRITRLQP
ncbi:MAG TPA: pyridoxamine 5'-phosphate oxidase [Pseudidiomarina sp.]|nr:pyridoxamine 5'-phosphate oxidase [Pseudidiomarina sp.]